MSCSPRVRGEREREGETTQKTPPTMASTMTGTAARSDNDSGPPTLANPLAYTDAFGSPRSLASFHCQRASAPWHVQITPTLGLGLTCCCSMLTSNDLPRLDKRLGMVPTGMLRDSLIHLHHRHQLPFVGIPSPPGRLLSPDTSAVPPQSHAHPSRIHASRGPKSLHHVLSVPRVATVPPSEAARPRLLHGADGRDGSRKAG